MLVGGSAEIVDRIAAAFEASSVRVVRVAHAAAACERLAIAMPQVVVVLGVLRAEERDAIQDRATAVGALVMHIDPELDPETLTELVDRTVRVAVQRNLARDAGPRGETADTVDDDDW